MNNNIIGKRIKEAMKKKGMRQSDIVRETGINKGALSSYISGKYEPKQTNIFKIASALNVSPGWLMGYNVSQEPDIEQKKILFRTTLNELLNYYEISKQEFSRENNINIETIDNWLNFKTLPSETEAFVICAFFDISNIEDLFNGKAYHSILEKYNNLMKTPDDRYKFGFILENMIDDISSELKISKSKIKSTLFKREKNFELISTYTELHNFLKNYIKNKID